MSDLKPCPFCGATPHRQMTKAVKVFVRDEPDGTGHYEMKQHEVAKCPHGCATLPIAAWNARTESAKSAWIPVGERLPVEGKTVQVWDSIHGRAVYEAYLRDGKFVAMFQVWSGCASHWQPLPEPPEVGA